MIYFLFLVMLVCGGCSLTKNYYDKESLSHCPKEYIETEHYDTYKGIYIYNKKDCGKNLPGEISYIKCLDDCKKECGDEWGEAYAYPDNLVICACTNNNISVIKDKTKGFK